MKNNKTYTHKRKPKRDFIFIDESGDPGEDKEYFIVGLIHLTDVSLEKLNVHLGAFRYFATIKKELKSSKLNKTQKEQLLNILKFSLDDGNFVKASVVYVKKDEYEGNYLFPKPDMYVDPLRFRHFIIRRLSEFHFENFEMQSEELEVVIDRFSSLELHEQWLKNYLRHEEFNHLPKFLRINQIDSRYVELLQITDWITGSVKDKFFVHPERDDGGIFEYINVNKIIR